MTNRTLWDACLGLLALSALVLPTALAVGVDDTGPVDVVLDGAGLADVTADACQPLYYGEKFGSFSANGRGTFALEGEAYDGCGDNGCDDSVEGYAYTNGAWRRMSVQEQGRWGEWCFVYCYYDGYSLQVDEVMQGHVSFLGPADAPTSITYNCGTSLDPGTWVFRGKLDLASDCEDSHGEPACG